MDTHQEHSHAHNMQMKDMPDHGSMINDFRREHRNTKGCEGLAHTTFFVCTHFFQNLKFCSQKTGADSVPTRKTGQHISLPVSQCIYFTTIRFSFVPFSVFSRIE